LTFNVEECNSKTVSRFQVDLKQNRLRSRKPVVEVNKIDSTRLGSRDPQVDLNRLTPRSNLIMLIQFDYSLQYFWDSAVFCAVS